MIAYGTIIILYFFFITGVHGKGCPHGFAADCQGEKGTAGPYYSCQTSKGICLSQGYCDPTKDEASNTRQCGNTNVCMNTPTYSTYFCYQPCKSFTTDCMDKIGQFNQSYKSCYDLSFTPQSTNGFRRLPRVCNVGGGCTVNSTIDQCGPSKVCQCMQGDKDCPPYGDCLEPPSSTSGSAPSSTPSNGTQSGSVSGGSSSGDASSGNASASGGTSGGSTSGGVGKKTQKKGKKKSKKEEKE